MDSHTAATKFHTVQHQIVVLPLDALELRNRDDCREVDRFGRFRRGRLDTIEDFLELAQGVERGRREGMMRRRPSTAAQLALVCI